MAKEFAEAFYKSKQWQKCREAYIKYVGGICENCYKKGIIKPGDIVHHKIKLTPENIYDEGVTLAWSNLCFVCRECHAVEHGARGARRYDITDDGTVVIKSPWSAR